MQLNIDTSNAKYQIKKYSPGCITVNDTEYYESIIIMPNFIAPLNSQSFLEAFKQNPEVILLGTGLDITMPSELLGNSLGIEIMTTRAACRTYTILAGEYRRVLAALMI